jgi:N-acetylglucosamine malate deacetylase 2
VPIDELLKSTLVLIAHPDDESIGCGILLQRIAEAHVLLCTNGAGAGGRPWYVRILRQKMQARRRLVEFRSALAVAGIRQSGTMPGIPDQTLHTFLDRAAAIVERHISAHRPEAVLTHAFEAGHPDHDSCAILARWAGLKFSLPVWEMPLYHRLTPSSPLIHQQFLYSTGDEVALCPTPEELEGKKRMLSQHQSQAAVISEFDAAREVFRPQPPYDFSVNPNPGLSNFAVCESIPIAGVIESFRYALSINGVLSPSNCRIRRTGAHYVA